MTPATDHEDEPGAHAPGEEWAQPGALLGDRLVVERRLGSGGMGYVVAARHSELGETVAVKLLLPGRALSEEAKNRLVREARAAARIRSAHVVRIFDVVSKGLGAPYVVMEFLTGETLAESLSRTGPLRLERAVEIVVQACEALGEAHRSGTVHRDLKPSNLFLTQVPGRSCFVKVLDFGIAKTRESDASTLTQSHALLASPAYASPEQLRASKQVDSRSDIWSLGVILYEILTGSLPYGGRALAEVSSQILRDPVPPPRSLRDDLPPELERAILRCLEKEPSGRFQDVESLVAALRNFAPEAARDCLAYLGDLGPSRAAPVPENAPEMDSANQRSTFTHASVAASSEGGPATRMSRRLMLLTAAGLTTTLAAVVLAFVRLQPGESAPPAASSLGAPKDARTRTAELASSAGERHAAPIASQRPPSPRATVTPTRTSAAAPAPSRRPARVSGGASARAESSKPASLETLPLNDLLDRRE